MTQQLDVDHPGKGRRMVKKKHPWRRLVVIVLIIVGLLVAADFGLAAAAESQVSKKLRTELQLDSDPDVRIHGFPFLTQAIAGDYHHVSVDADGVHLGNTFHDLSIHADLKGVHVHLSEVFGGSLSEIPIDKVTGSVAVQAEDIRRLVENDATGRLLDLKDLTIGPASVKQVLSSSAEGSDDTSGPNGSAHRQGGQENNRNRTGNDVESDSTSHYSKRVGVRLGVYLDIAGKNNWITTYALVSLHNGKIRIAPKRLKLTNDVVSTGLSGLVRDTLLRTFRITLDPGDLPFHAKALGVSVRSGAVAVKGEAHDVVIHTG